MTRDQLAEALATRKAAVSAAVRDLLKSSDGCVVEVRVAGRKKTSAWPLWTRERAEATPGVDIVPSGFGGIS